MTTQQPCRSKFYRASAINIKRMPRSLSIGKIEIKVFISRLTTLKWRLRHNACYILAYVLILLAGLSMAVFMGISSGNKAGLSDEGWSVLGGFFHSKHNPSRQNIVLVFVDVLD